MAKPQVLVTSPEYKKGIQTFLDVSDMHFIEAPEEESALAKMIQEEVPRAVIVGVAPYLDEFYSALAKGSVIARFGVGTSNIDFEKAKARDLLVVNTPGALDDAVAEHAIALLLAAAKNLSSHTKAMQSGEFHAVRSLDLKGKVLLIVGPGSIGQSVARIASSGLGMKVHAFGRRKFDCEKLGTQCGISESHTELERALSVADFVSIHVPLASSTEKMVDASFLNLMKSDAVLVNTARGGIVDEVALFNALQRGVISAAALDVFEHEPYVPVDPTSDLRQLQNIVLTPHVASNTESANRNMARMCVENIRTSFL